MVRSRTLAVLVATVAAALVTAAPSGAASAHHYTQFESPSRNIGCVLLDGLARCDIMVRSWSPPVATNRPWPKSTMRGQPAGRAGGDHDRTMMSQRARPSRSTQPMLRLGDSNCV